MTATHSETSKDISQDDIPPLGNSRAIRVLRIAAVFIAILALFIRLNFAIIGCFTVGKLNPLRYELCSTALDAPLAFGRLRVLLQHQQVYAADALGKAEAALNHSNALIADGQAFPFVYFVRARSLDTLGKPEDALREYVALSAKFPDHPWYAFETAMAQLDAKLDEDALSTGRRFVDRNPKGGVGHAILGWVTFKQGNLSEAIQHFEVATAVKPNEGRYHAMLSTVLTASGQMERAAVERDLAKKLQHRLGGPEDS
jgi:tetratricopeptide (TPR) repeat protein